jgi:hypothetical protein
LAENQQVAEKPGSTEGPAADQGMSGGMVKSSRGAALEAAGACTWKSLMREA